MEEIRSIPDVAGRDIGKQAEISRTWITGTPLETITIDVTDEAVVASVRLVNGQFAPEELEYYRAQGYLVVNEPWGYAIYAE